MNRVVLRHATWLGQRQPYYRSVAVNVLRLAGVMVTIIGAVGSGRDEDLVSVARGSSETWLQLPNTLAMENSNELSHVRLMVGERTLLGALVMGDQKLSLPLQEMIAEQSDITPIRSQLLQPGASTGSGCNGFLVKSKSLMSTEMHRDNKELWLSLLAAVLVAAVYAFMVSWYHAIPAAGSLFGHLIGVIGFLLMLLTETFYSIRKRSRKARWGSMQSWLQLHIFTGLVGPFMVSAAHILEVQRIGWSYHAPDDHHCHQWICMDATSTRLFLVPWRASRKQKRAHRRLLWFSARRLLAVWHAIHIPIGIALFTAAFIHIGAALYYATLLR